MSYEGFAAAWPAMTDQVGLAEKMNAMPKYVVSTTLERAGWNNSTVIGATLADEVAALKQRHDGDIRTAGSGQLVGSLMDHGLIDELRLMVFPVVLGSGRRLFPQGTATTRLRLTGSQPVGPDGVIALTCVPVHDPVHDGDGA